MNVGTYIWDELEANFQHTLVCAIFEHYIVWSWHQFYGTFLSSFSQNAS